MTPAAAFWAGFAACWSLGWYARAAWYVLTLGRRPTVEELGGVALAPLVGPLAAAVGIYLAAVRWWRGC